MRPGLLLGETGGQTLGDTPGVFFARQAHVLTRHTFRVIIRVMATSSTWHVAFYQDALGRRPVQEWLMELAVTDRARVRRTLALLEAYGILLTMPHARHLHGKLWELRVAAGRRDYRVLYAAVVGRRFVLLHGFDKKTAKTPRRELEIAVHRLADFDARETGKE